MMDESKFGAMMDAEGDETLDQAIERAGMHVAAKKLTDPEWRTPKHYHSHVLLEAVAWGLISADPWFVGYTLRDDFADVVNHIAKRLEEDPPGDGCPEVRLVSLLALQDWFRRELMAEPRFVAWNDGPGSGVTSRYTPTPTEREFMDLDAAINNIVIKLRNETRASEAFDAKFEAEHGEAPE